MNQINTKVKQRGVWWSLQEANPEMDKGEGPKYDLACMQKCKWDVGS